MRLLYVSHSFPPGDQPLSNIGGMQRVSVDLHDALSRNPHVQLSSLVLRTSRRWTDIRTGPFLLKLLHALPRTVREQRIEAILYSSLVTASIAPLVRTRLVGTGVLSTAIPIGRDVTLPVPIYQRLVPRVLRSLDLLFPISRATADACLQRGARPGPLYVVPCGVDLRRFPPVADRSAGRAALLRMLRDSGEPIAGDPLLLLSVGRHQKRKGFDWFIDEVFPRLSHDVVYLLAGAGPMTPAIREAVALRGLGERVRVLGVLPEESLLTLYRGADLFIMPNVEVPGDIEGFGVVMLEAGASGLPVLAADLEGPRDVIAEGENGHLLPSGNADAFVAALSRYRDRSTLPAAADRAAAHVARAFDWARITGRYLETIGSHL